MNTRQNLSSRPQQLAALGAALVVTFSLLSALTQVAGAYQAQERLAAAPPAKAASQQQLVVAGQRANGG